jgi:hypothetical protein
VSQLNQTETSVVAMAAILNPPGIAAPEATERDLVETDGPPPKEADAKPTKKARKRRVMQPRAPPLVASQGCMDLPEFLIWARVSRTTAFKEVAAGRLVVRRIGRKMLIPLENAEAWLNSLPTSRAA